MDRRAVDGYSMLCPSCRVPNESSAENCAACGESLSGLPPGRVLGQRYEIVRPLGKGGMGMVFEARDRVLDETVALKVLRTDVVSTPELARRFRQEIKLARRVRHKNVCGIHEYGEDGSLHFIVMDLVEGTDLRREVQRRGPLPTREACDVALRIAEGLAAIEVNISCPNKREWGRIIATDLELTREVVRLVRTRCRLPMWVKLSPNVTDIASFARVAEEEGADAISLINTLLGMAVDLGRRRPALTNVTGGLSGPAIKPVALRMVYEVARAVRIPVIGMGGIGSGDDALEFLLVGARAVQVGTASFTDPCATERIAAEVTAGLRRRGCRDIDDWIGSLDGVPTPRLT